LTGHAHHRQLPVGSKLKIGIVLTVFIMVVELVGGVLSNSLALLSDAGHVFADVIALSLSWYGVRQAERPASSRMTFGYHRVGVLIALFNAATILAIAGIIFYEAYRRWQAPPEVNSPLMLAAAVVGLSVNVFIAFWLRKEQRDNLNVRSAFWHVLGDALASVGVIVGAIIILLTGWFVVDPIVSVVIGFIITLAAWRILREGLKVLLEATPSQVDVTRMINTLKAIPGVKGIHDVHVWSISPELHAMSCHVLTEELTMSQAAEIRQEIERVLRGQFDIEHSALQMECRECGANDLFCSLAPASSEKDDNPHHEH
jgi:cobalt-zinc-cadmium efflux system protein